MTTYYRDYNDTWSFWDANTKEYTHGYHTYPAMMIPQVCRTLINKFKPNDKCELIFDPYMGSGTTLVEANIAGINAVGTDLNPLARLMAIVKTTHYSEASVKNGIDFIKLNCENYSENKVVNCNFDRISNYSFWYTSNVLLKLAYLNQIIEELNENLDFFRLILAETVRETSLTRNGEFKRFRMSPESIEKFNPDVFKIFHQKALRNFNGLRQFNKTQHTAFSKVYGFNSAEAIPENIIGKESVDMVVTSPPYGDSKTTVAYGQFSRWANEWFNFENASNLDSILMGGKKTKKENFTTNTIRNTLNTIELKNKKRYLEVVSFLNDYWNSIQNVASCIRKGGVVCYVVGNRTVKETQIPLDYFTAEMFEKCGFKHVTTIVRSIPNKRMPSKTSPSNITGAKVSTMTNEFIVILKKE